MDYKQFLQKPGQLRRLPYFTGKSWCDAQSTYRLRETLTPGWYQFVQTGRYVTPEGTIEPELHAWKLRQVTGYLMNARLLGNDFQGRLFGLPGDVDLPKFTP